MKAWVFAGLLSPWLTASAAHSTPELWLWAWPSPRDAGVFDAPHVTGVAYLAATLRLVGPRVEFQPRRQPLHSSDRLARLPVVRIEVPADAAATLDAPQRSEVVRRVLSLVRNARTNAVQIDFDARLGERDFYRALLLQLRGALGSEFTLSMTALASWCLDDDWLDGELAVDEIVPMVFDMGSEAKQVHRRVERGPFPNSVCRRALGVRLGQRLPPLHGAGRVYAFTAGAWTPNAVGELTRRLGFAR